MQESTRKVEISHKSKYKSGKDVNGGERNEKNRWNSLENEEGYLEMQRNMGIF